MNKIETYVMSYAQTPIANPIAKHFLLLLLSEAPELLLEWIKMFLCLLAPYRCCSQAFPLNLFLGLRSKDINSGIFYSATCIDSKVVHVITDR